MMNSWRWLSAKRLAVAQAAAAAAKEAVSWASSTTGARSQVRRTQAASRTLGDI